MHRELDNIIEHICEKDSRYERDSYEFILEALTFTQKKYRRLRHVTGEELLEGIREFALLQFGPLALAVLTHWGIKTTEDFGFIVFNLVQNKMLSKTEQDTIDSFKSGYDFKKAFRDDYHKQLEKRISKMKTG